MPSSNHSTPRRRTKSGPSLLREHGEVNGLQAAADVIRNSEFFDPDWYVSQNAGGLKIMEILRFTTCATDVVLASSRVRSFPVNATSNDIPMLRPRISTPFGIIFGTVATRVGSSSPR